MEISPEEYFDHWHVRQLMREWRRVRPRVLVAEAKKDWETLWEVFVSLRPYIHAAFRALEEVKNDEANVLLLTAWAFSSSLWSKHLGRKEEEGLWISLGYLFADLNEQEYLPLEGAVV